MLLYYITDRKQLGETEALRRERLLECIGRASAAGVDYIQLREKDLATRDLLDLARAARAAMCGGSKLLINARVDVAIAAGTDGVHLPGGEIAASDTRVAFERAGVSKAVVAVSCHSREEVALAEAQGADFAVFAPVFRKSDSAGVGVAALATACMRPAAAAASMPVLALGGVTTQNAALCLQAGAAGVAGIRIFQQAEDMAAVCREMRALPVPISKEASPSAYATLASPRERT